jgi:hypothetical protein
MLNAWAFVWLCGLKSFFEKLERFLSKGLKRKEKEKNKTKPSFSSF